MSKGICYGVSVGPGDPELITLKAYRIVKEADVIFLPSAPKENCRVYNILKGALHEDVDEKVICIDTSQMADPKNQGERYDILAHNVAMILDEGKTVAFPALGEVCLYSTYMYVYERLSDMGYECRHISGISSVQEAANRMLISLAQGDEEVHVFPDTDNQAEKLCLPGTKVFMKPKGDNSSFIEGIKAYCEANPDSEVYGVSNIGCDKEISAFGVDNLTKLSGYMTVYIVKG